MSYQDNRYQGAPLSEYSAITRVVNVAGGVFAPGHLGELTQLIPFEMVGEALRATATVRSRVRELPSRVVVYLLLAAALFEGQSYGQVWARLCAGLGADAPKAPTRAGLWQARARVGVRPMRWLFDLLRGPAPTAVRWRGLLVCAIDGTTTVVPDTPANTTRFPKQGGNHGGCGYPLIRVVGRLRHPHPHRRRVRPMRQRRDHLRLAAAAQLARGHAAAGRPQLRRRENVPRHRPAPRTRGDPVQDLKQRPETAGAAPPWRRSWLSRFGGIQVRVIDAQIAIATTEGRHTGHYRWITTLLDHRRYPAFEVAQIYHERWEIETCYLELKATILGGRVLRARTPTRVEQEVYALLIVYQLLRTAIADTALAAGIDPDRASFTIALNTA